MCFFCSVHHTLSLTCREGHGIHVQYNPSSHKFAVVTSSGFDISSDTSSQSEQSQSSETEEEIKKPKHKSKAQCKQSKGTKQSKTNLKESALTTLLKPSSASDTFEVPASLFFAPPPTEHATSPQTVTLPASLMCLKEIKPTLLSFPSSPIRSDP